MAREPSRGAVRDGDGWRVSMRIELGLGRMVNVYRFGSGRV